MINRNIKYHRKNRKFVSIHTCKIYKIFNRVQESENVMIHVDSYSKKKKEQKAKESNLGIYLVKKNW